MLFCLKHEVFVVENTLVVHRTIDNQIHLNKIGHVQKIFHSLLGFNVSHLRMLVQIFLDQCGNRIQMVISFLAIILNFPNDCSCKRFIINLTPTCCDCEFIRDMSAPLPYPPTNLDDEGTSRMRGIFLLKNLYAFQIVNTNSCADNRLIQMNKARYSAESFRLHIPPDGVSAYP